MVALTCWLTYSATVLAAAPIDDIKLKIWANNTIVTLYNYDYKTLKSVQSASSKNFTLKGWQAFVAAFLASGLKETVINNKYTVSSITMRPPEISKQGVLASKYQWQVGMPIVAVYKNEQQQQVQYLKVKLTILYQDGQAKIDSFYAKEGKVPTCPESKAPTSSPDDKASEQGSDSKTPNAAATTKSS
jgi:hypothetical protein